MYFVLLVFYGLPLCYLYSYIFRIIVLIKKCFFSGYISSRGKLIGYDVLSSHHDKETDRIKYRYSRVYEYMIDGNNYKGVAYGDCASNKHIGKKQVIKYNPDDFSDLVVVSDFFYWFGIIILNILIVIGLTIFLKLAFFPDLLLVLLLMLGIVLFFKGVNYFRNNGVKKKMGSKLELSCDIDVYKEISNDEGSVHFVEPIHFVKFSSNSKNIEDSILNRLIEHDSNFSVTSFKQMAILYFRELQKAYMSNNFDKVRVFSSDNFYNNRCKAFLNFDFNECEFVSFLFSNILEYNVSNDVEILGFQVSVKWRNIGTNSEFASTYYMEFIRKFGVLTNNNDGLVSTNCPNCGAATSVTGIGECKNCGKVIMTSDFSWILNKMCYWDER